MKRIRIVFLLLALVLLASLALLFDKATSSVAAEREMRHQILADRIVDEMESELSTWLRREEDRPFAQYRYFFVPEGSPTQLVNLSRSPLSQPPREPFVVCYFQIDPGGRVSSPLWPDNEKLAALATGWQPLPEVRAVVDLVDEAVRDFWSTETAALGAQTGGRQSSDGLTGDGLEADDSSASRDTAIALARSKSQTLPEPEVKKRLTKREIAAEQQRRALTSLNRGAAARKERPAKVETSQAANVYNFLQQEANELQSAVESQAEALDESLEAAEPLPTTQEIERGIAQALQVEASATIDVRLKPMAGRLATPSHLVLYRTVSIGREVYRQGLMLDVPALVDWVAARVLSGSDLAAPARVALADDAASRWLSPSYSFRHRFAEPFAAIATDVFLDPLPEVRTLFNLTNLSLLLAFAATFGLFALYRMVAVAVTYAERRNNFVSAVTHELKTPLTAIRMYGEMLRDGMVPKGGKRQQYYEIMTAETERLTRLVQNVLELSQLEQKKRSMKIEVGDVVPVVRQALALIEPHAEKKGFSLRLVAGENLPPVRYDRDALLQVLFNLVDNALKYSGDAQDREVVLSCIAQGDRVVVTVADHGPGVPRRHLKKIFEPFYRAENELTRTSKGTGIGLALVRGLVEQMGGSVAGSNSAGGGFEVEVSLATG